MLKLSLMPLLLVQLLGTTDFMLVMPLGPSLAEGFNIPVENTAWLSGVFAICAAISGFVFAKHLDKFERKKLLCILLLVSAALFFISSQLQHFESWLVLRGLIGFLSTPIAALSMAIAIDLSEEHRTQAMAQMSLGFSLAAILVCLRVYSWPIFQVGKLSTVSRRALHCFYHVFAGGNYPQ